MRQSAAVLIEADSAEATRAIGARLAAALDHAPRDRPWLVTFSGDLGAGKTTLVGGLLAALGHAGPARSPTYTLVEPYRFDGRDWYHCDLYRLRHPDELDDIGLVDLMTPGAVLLVEWPDRAGGRLGPADVAVNLTYRDGGRGIEFVDGSDAGQQLVAYVSGQT